MSTDTAVKSIAKGLALGVLIPTAFVYIAACKMSSAVGETANEALDLARRWEEQAEAGAAEAYQVAQKLV